MALAREVKALTAILADPANEEKTAEQLAAELIEALDENRASFPRAAVVVRHRWLGGSYSLAVIGPFGAGAKAQARRLGEDACMSLTHGGDGRAVIAPAYATPRQAWDAIKPPSRAELIREQVRRDLESWTPELWRPDDPPCPTCRCGLVGSGPCLVHKKRNEAA